MVWIKQTNLCAFISKSKKFKNTQCGARCVGEYCCKHKHLITSNTNCIPCSAVSKCDNGRYVRCCIPTYSKSGVCSYHQKHKRSFIKTGKGKAA